MFAQGCYKARKLGAESHSTTVKSAIAGLNLLATTREDRMGQVLS